MDEEIWKAVVGYEGYYEVSSHGRVRSLPRISIRLMPNGTTVTQPRKLRYLSPRLERYGYMRVGLSLGTRETNYLLHRIVAIAFHPNPENLAEVNHKDFTPTNCRADNLEWKSTEDNKKYSADAGRFRPDTNPNMARKLTAEQVIEIKKQLKAGRVQRLIALDFSVAEASINGIHRGRRWLPIAVNISTDT